MSELIDLENCTARSNPAGCAKKPRRSFRDILTGSVPYWIVVVALVLYSLSAPHTAGVSDKLTPAGALSPL
jgi:hypothetical protein